MAKIVTGTGEYEIRYSGNSYTVIGFRYMRRGAPQAIRGCRTDLEAYKLARAAAKKTGRDVSAWRFVVED